MKRPSVYDVCVAKGERISCLVVENDRVGRVFKIGNRVRYRAGSCTMPENRRFSNDFTVESTHFRILRGEGVGRMMVNGDSCPEALYI